MPYNKVYRQDAATTGEYVPGIHEALDSYGPVGCPLYTPERGEIIEVVRVGQPSRRFGAVTSGLYVAVKILGNRPETEVVLVLKHMAPLIVAEEGQILEKDGHLGYQGWTGHVIPAGPGGEHCHQELFVNMARWDPTEYLLGNKSLIIDPIPAPQEDIDMARLPFPIQMEYIDPDNLAVHSSISLDPATTVSRIAPGDRVTIDTVAEAFGHRWGHNDAGWFSMGSDRIWFAPIAVEDQSEEIRTLQARLNASTSQVNAAVAQAAAFRAKLTQINGLSAV